MLTINIFSILLFIIFIILYLSKLVILYKRNNIKANVLGKGKKNKEIKYTESFVKSATFLWGLLWFIESLWDKYIIKYFPYIFDVLAIRYIGLVFVTIGLMIFGVAAFSMKSSWRVGIDKSTNTTLITNGIYKYSRNPAFLGFDFMFIGLFMLFPNILTLITILLSAFSIHLLILQEEKHLLEVFGREYDNYKKATGRYLF